MKTINEIKKLSLILIICLNSIFLLAQENINKNETRESRKIAFFTNKMQLTVEESQNFWPIVNEMDAELKALKKEQKEKLTPIKEKENVSDEDLEKLMDMKMEMSKKQLDIKIKYHGKFKDVLPIKKVAKYYEATKEFKKLQAKRKENYKR
ncbi:MAG: hypothetical protein CL846_04120 [Crocinitomicaceae bacterium]|nr:hypothetical protein [Crocinitomicaceae bacterium]|tara:strand:- start:7226 stop:7678 length:453 start_codon:yes stop_codon:yes gene_type:complete